MSISPICLDSDYVGLFLDNLCIFLTSLKLPVPAPENLILGQ